MVIIFLFDFILKFLVTKKMHVCGGKKGKNWAWLNFCGHTSNWLILLVPWCLLSILSCRSFWRFLAGTGYSQPWRWPDESVTDDHYHPHPPTGHCLLGYVKLGKYGTNAQVHIYNDISISYILIHLTIW